MRLFRPRGRDDAEQNTRSPLAQATALYKAGRHAEAEAEARAVAAARSRPRDDVFAPLALGMAALATGAQGRNAEACAGYDALLPVFGRIYGAEHPLTLKLRSDRAQTLSALSRHAECEAECAAVARAATRGTAPEMPLIAAAARNGQVYALTAQGRHTEGEALAREALAAHRIPDRLTLVLRLGLARSLNGQARHDEALAEAERADELRRGLPETSAALRPAPSNWPWPPPSWGWAAVPRPTPGPRPPMMPVGPPSVRTTAAPSRPGRCSTASTALDRAHRAGGRDAQL
ncbi:tetratricopeptide repeat protein [Streptomyces sp. NPDC005708]|uniref:tetratricopeptide repeat protein n=1 Tax=Streptomyces sp. NPDC005708 TaxID=3154564 RepID=UPI0033F29EC2